MPMPLPWRPIRCNVSRLSTAGRIGLLAQDVSELNELNRELAHRRMELQRQNELLTADYDLKTHLADQEAETLLVQDVDQALARASKRCTTC